MDDGLAHNYVLSMFQDSRGLLWVGTYGGVQVFDGYRFNHFNIIGKELANKISNTTVHVILEDKNGDMWFGTENGLNHYEVKSGRMTVYLSISEDPTTIAGTNIRAIDEDENGTLWIGTYEGGLSKLDIVTKKIERIVIEDQNENRIQGPYINTLFRDQKNKLWIGTEANGLYVFDTETEKMDQKIMGQLQSLNSVTINSIYQDDFGKIWIGTWDQGLWKYDSEIEEIEQFVSTTKPNSISGNIIRTICRQDANHIWVGTYGQGLNLLDLRSDQFERVKIKSFDEENNAQDFIWSSHYSAGNFVWFGSFGKGMYKLNSLKKTFSYYPIYDQKEKVQVTSMANDNQSLWIGSLQNGLYRTDLQNGEQVNINHPNIGKEINKLLMDSQGNLWIGMPGQLMVIEKDGAVRQFIENPNRKGGYPGKVINCLTEDQDGNIWIGFFKAELSVLMKSELRKPDDQVNFLGNQELGFSDSEPLYGRIWCIEQNKKGQMMIGSSNDLIIYELASQKMERLPYGVVTNVQEDDYGNYWILTNGSGIHKLDKSFSKIKTIGYDQGLNCLDIQAAEVDQEGKLWLGSSCGIVMIDPKTDALAIFDENYGVKRFGVNFQSSSLLSNGNIAFGGPDGINRFDPNKVNKETSPTNIHITDIKLNNRSLAFENSMDTTARIMSLLAEVDTFRLEDNSDVLTLHFSAYDFETPTSMTYAYHLEGYDQQWVITDANNRSATYSQLKPGFYTFQVKTTHNRGTWDDNIRTLVIDVPGAYWESTWFRILVVALTLCTLTFILFLVFVRYKLVIGLEKKHKYLEQLRIEKDVIQLKNEELEETVNRYNARIRAMSIRYAALKEHLNSMYQSVVSSVQNIPDQDNKSELQKMSMNFEDSLKTLNEEKLFEETLEVDRDNFLSRFANACPKLSSTDLRICSLVRLNKSNKEIAQELNIALSSLEQSRYRIRKKMNLSSDVNLNDLIIRF